MQTISKKQQMLSTLKMHLQGTTMGTEIDILIRKE